MQTLQNGIIVPTNSDEYNPTQHMADAFYAADVVIRVASQAARDALVKRDGMAVARMDWGGMIEVWDADLSLWSRGQHHTEFTGSVAITTNTNWGSGALTRDTGQTSYGTDITSPGNDLIFFPGGRIYSVHVRVKLDAPAAGTTFLSLRNNATAFEYTSGDIAPGAAATEVAIPNLNFKTDTTLKLFFYSGAPTGTVLSTRARLTWIQ